MLAASKITVMMLANPQGRLRVTVVVWCEICFARAAQYVIHLLKLQCHYASLGKFYKLNVWIVPALLYLKVMAIFAMRHFSHTNV